MMTGLLAFRDRYAAEQAGIAALASVRWRRGFVCAACAGRRSYQLRARPRVFECAGLVEVDEGHYGVDLPASTSAAGSPSWVRQRAPTSPSRYGIVSEESPSLLLWAKSIR